MWYGKNTKNSSERLDSKMKKFRKFLIGSVLIIALGIAAFYGLQQLREKRMWPFNSGLSRILPPSFKQFAYNTTNPDQKVVSSFLHIIRVAYYNIPDPGAVGGGGAINKIGLGKLLVTLNNGQSLLFDPNTGKFITIIYWVAYAYVLSDEKIEGVSKIVLVDSNTKTKVGQL